MTSHTVLTAFVAAALLTACASEAPYDPLQDYEELDSASIVPAPRPAAQRVAPADRDAVERGAYLVELLGCGACHTDGALEGAPDTSRALAGSRTGIAYTNPLEHENPGVVYPPNITPDETTGIGLWSDTQIADARCRGDRRLPQEHRTGRIRGAGRGASWP
jgi:mono/diheme cytochrome c family protein